ncbi:MAG: recombinase family protein [Clostridia bacterium]|nr:recombinase family protein [Clostridia bacterium]
MEASNFDNKSYTVALYMRLSKDDGDKEESESITNQRKILKEFVKENNYNIYDEYIDDGYSGTNFNRPNFKRMIKDIETRKVNMVITKNLARLGRDYIETGRYIETFFPENEIRYIAILDDVDTYLDKNCDTVAFKNIMNDFYAKETSKNIKKTKNRKKQEGFYYTSYAPFGYTKIDKAGNLKINEVTADIVRKIFKEFIGGKGTYQIAQLLNKEKVVTPGLSMNMTGVVNNITNTTNIWRHTTIKRILTNPIYIGTVVQNKRKKISYKSKKMITLPESQHTITENHHPAIIDIETWNMVQSLFKKYIGEKIKEEDPLLKSLLYCYHCQNKLQIVKKKDKYKDKVTIRRYIICSTATREVTNKICYRQYVNYDRLEEKILNKISNIFREYITSNVFNNKHLLENLIKSQNNKGKLEEKIEQINTQLNILNKKISTLYNDKLGGLIEEQDYICFSENMIKERHKLEKLKEITQEEIKEFDKKYDDKKMEDKIQNVIEKIANKNELKKEDVQQLVNKIEIDKDKNVLIHFNFYELNCIGG